VPSLPPKKQKKSLFGRGDKSGAPKKEKKDKKKAASDKGAQFIEFAALTPLLLLAALAVWQVLLFGITSMYAGHAANAAARHAAARPAGCGKSTGQADSRGSAHWDSTAPSHIDLEHPRDGAP